MSESTITKLALTAGLKQVMKEKSFDKVTIADITKACGLGRQSFYYHFQDKYELLNWIFCNEVIVVLTKELSLETWSENLYRMLCVLKEQRVFYKNAIKHSFQDEFHSYLFQISTELFCTIIEHMDVNKQILETDKQFLAKFFSYGIVGSIISWITEDMVKSPEELRDIIVSLVHSCKAYAAKRYQLEHS